MASTPGVPRSDHQPPSPGRASSMKKVLALSLTVAIAIVMSGCTDSDAPKNSTTNSTGLRHVRVAALPIAETAALWAGIAQGIFTRHGLDVEVLPAQGGALAIPALT